MPKTITSSVGRGGRNFPPVDVMTVQYLLNCVPMQHGGANPELVVDGAVGPKTIAAIEKFQRGNVGACDGRVDPGGATLRMLQAKANDPYPNQPLNANAIKSGGGQAGKTSSGNPFGQKVNSGGLKGSEQQVGLKGGQGGAGQSGGQCGQKTGGMPQGGGGFPFPQKGGGGAKGF